MNTIDTINTIEQLVYEAHQNAVLHGFYEDESVNHPGVKCILMVTEISELFEGVRNGDNIKPDRHCPDFSNEEIEAADLFIRLADYSGFRKLRLGAAILAKHEYNKSRPYKHNKLC